MDYTFKTLEFEGPLDLLLHLIKEANINIFEILTLYNERNGI